MLGSSSGLGHRPLTAVTGVRLPYRVPTLPVNLDAGTKTPDGVWGFCYPKHFFTFSVCRRCSKAFNRIPSYIGSRFRLILGFKSLFCALVAIISAVFSLFSITFLSPQFIGQVCPFLSTSSLYYHRESGQSVFPLSALTPIRNNYLAGEAIICAKPANCLRKPTKELNIKCLR